MLYKSTQEARDGTRVPLFSDGKTMFSRYAPLKEVENFGSHIQIEGEFGGFFVVAGLGNGIHIQALRKRFPKSRILIVEKSLHEIQWLKDNFDLSHLLSLDTIWLTTVAQAAQTFIQMYNPLLHGNFFFLPVRSWYDQIPEEGATLKASLEQAVASIAADYSTQAHFGKIWFRNFFLNLKSLADTPPQLQLEIKKDTAFVAAAGPSLDTFISDLQNPNIREKIYLIATDTALPPLLRQGITPEMTVTIDGQGASTRHFLQNIPNSMVLAADISSSPDVVVRCKNNGCPILFFRNKNPLPLLFANYLKEQHVNSYSLPEIDTGSGTVTSAAVDIAYKLGFSHIQVGGADFAYIQGKPYCRGTYFEDQFCNSSHRTETTEQKYVALQYRSKIIKQGEKISTHVLDEYRKSFFEYIQQHGKVSIITDNKTITLPKNDTNKTSNSSISMIKIPSLSRKNYNDFVAWYKNLLEKQDDSVISSILPLFSWYLKKNNDKCDIFHIMKLAYSLTVRYTEPYGK